MGLTKDFRETTYARIQRDVTFRKTLLTEAVNAYLSGEETTGKTVLRDFVNATIGFERLGALAEVPSKSLHRMLSPTGNPNTANFFAVLRILQEQDRVQLKVRATRKNND
jgi:DNA-binding phage protein